ncbi:hypothetical protein JHK82_015851 [Glycine max]|nr:hypothetical protein JHK86_015879 [Glycine max]KAG5148970.1 hypothetical protein JHK82_015851 [Glycine max]
MPQAIVNFVVQSLGDLLIQEGMFLYRLEDKVLQLQTDLRMMRSYLGASRRNLTGVLSLIKRYALNINKFIETHKVGSHVDNVIARISSLTRSLETYGIRPEEGEASNSMHGKQRSLSSYSHVIEEDIIGVQDDVRILELCLVDPNKGYRVVAICGMRDQVDSQETTRPKTHADLLFLTADHLPPKLSLLRMTLSNQQWKQWKKEPYLDEERKNGARGRRRDTCRKTEEEEMARGRAPTTAS